MRLLADECVDAGLVAFLRGKGFDVLYVAEIAPAISDEAVMRRAQADHRLLLTENKDFGELAFRRGGLAPGIVLLRIDPAMHEAKIERMAAAIDRLGENLFGHYTIVEMSRFRVRPLLR